MAEITLTREDMRSGVPSCLVSWSGMANGDTGQQTELIDYPDRTITFTGTFGVGGSVTVQGSNDGSNWFAMTDPQGNAITKTSASMEMLSEAPRYIRPIVTAGDGTTAIVAQILCRRTTR